jgi:hypothetical protein
LHDTWPIQSDFVKSAFQPFEWPEPKEYDSLVVSIIQRTFSFVLPLAVGMYLYSLRQSQRILDRRYERPARSFSWVAAVQTMFSLFVNLMFATYFVFVVKKEHPDGDPLFFFQTKVWAEAIISSVAPSVALIAWIICGRYRSKLVASLAICLVASVLFFLADFTYEKNRNNQRLLLA